MSNVLEEEWPDVIFDDNTSYEEYNRLIDSIGELTSAILDCKVKGIMLPSVARPLRDFLTSVLSTLDEGIDW